MKTKLLSVLCAVCVVFFLLTAAIGLPIYIRPFYYAHIEAFDLARVSGYSEEEIREAYDEVLDYLTLPGKEFGTGVLPHSAEGKAHFEDCKVLFDLNRNVLLVFQPAEETTGGARDICKTGLFKLYKVNAIFGLHLWPGLEAGTVACRKNEMMARTCEVKVDIYGKTTHIAKLEEGIDALNAGVDFYHRVRALEAALPKKVFRLLKFGKFTSGTVCNAISDHTHMEGSLRAFQDEVFYSLRAGIVSVGKDVERSTGCTVNIYMNDGYPAVMNPGDLYKRVKKVADFAELEAPSMIADDFAWYQKTIPGLFFFLGTGDTPALHADDFNFDEQILLKGADFFEALAENFR